MINPKNIITAFTAAALSACAASDGISEEVTTNTETVTSSVTATEATKPAVTAISYEIDPEKPMVALTFDDGPNITTTVSVLTKLEQYQVPASFFLVGNNITPSTEWVVKRAYDMGCEINNHSKSHEYMNKLTADEIKAEVDYVSDKVEQITGEPTKFFRPPYIAVNDEMYAAIDMPFICGAGCNDWDSKVTVSERVEKTIAQAEDGVIILLHDSMGNTQTVEALDEIIPSLLDAGYQFVTVSELFEAKGIAVDPEDNQLYTVVK